MGKPRLVLLDLVVKGPRPGSGPPVTAGLPLLQQRGRKGLVLMAMQAGSG